MIRRYIKWLLFFACCAAFDDFERGDILAGASNQNEKQKRKERQAFTNVDKIFFMGETSFWDRQLSRSHIIIPELFYLEVINGSGDGLYKAGAIVEIISKCNDHAEWQTSIGDPFIKDVNEAITELTISSEDTLVRSICNEKPPPSMPYTPLPSIKTTDAPTPEPSRKFYLEVIDGSGDGLYKAGEIVECVSKCNDHAEWKTSIGDPFIKDVNEAITDLTMPSEDTLVRSICNEKPPPSTPSTPLPSIKPINAPNPEPSRPPSSPPYSSCGPTPTDIKFELLVISGRGDGFYSPGESVHIVAFPPPKGWIFCNWIILLGSPIITDKTNPETTLRMPEEDAEITVFYCRSKTKPPTIIPSLTNSPSTNPSSVPTATPSHVPTIQPNPSPTNLPSSFPTKNPSAVRSETPTISFQPSIVPTPSRSNSPTEKTSSPSSLPTLIADPSASPTQISMVPSSLPSNSPTEQTLSPSFSPTLIADPSASPTQISVVPSSLPSNLPTEQTLSPSSSPTLIVEPSTSPTQIRVSSSPTDPPSEQTETPSSSPTLIVEPSASPTQIPIPSLSPSSSPTEESSSPSSLPTQSISPTTLPTLPESTPVPSKKPSEKPGPRPVQPPTLAPCRPYTLTVVSGSGDGEYCSAKVIPIKSKPPPSGLVFYEWIIVSGGDVPITDSKSAVTTVTMMDTDVILKATYKKDRIRFLHESNCTPFSLNVNSGVGQGRYCQGETHKISANPPPSGLEFCNWLVVSGNPIIVDPNASNTIITIPSGDSEVTALYCTDPSKISKSTKLHSLSVREGSGSGTYTQGSRIEIDATPLRESSPFIRWVVISGNAKIDKITSSITLLTMADSDSIIRAEFISPPTSYPASDPDLYSS